MELLCHAVLTGTVKCPLGTLLKHQFKRFGMVTRSHGSEECMLKRDGIRLHCVVIAAFTDTSLQKSGLSHGSRWECELCCSKGPFVQAPHGRKRISLTDLMMCGFTGLIITLCYRTQILEAEFLSVASPNSVAVGVKTASETVLPFCRVLVELDTLRSRRIKVNVWILV